MARRSRRVPVEAPADVWPPEEWPDWVLGYPAGFLPDDPGRSIAGFHRWRAERDAWFEEHRPDLVGRHFMLRQEERRRRRE